MGLSIFNRSTQKQHHTGNPPPPSWISIFLDFLFLRRRILFYQLTDPPIFLLWHFWIFTETLQFKVCNITVNIHFRAKGVPGKTEFQDGVGLPRLGRINNTFVTKSLNKVHESKSFLTLMYGWNKGSSIVFSLSKTSGLLALVAKL